MTKFMLRFHEFTDLHRSNLFYVVRASISHRCGKLGFRLNALVCLKILCYQSLTIWNLPTILSRCIRSSTDPPLRIVFCESWYGWDLRIKRSEVSDVFHNVREEFLLRYPDYCFLNGKERFGYALPSQFSDVFTVFGRHVNRRDPSYDSTQILLDHVRSLYVQQFISDATVVSVSSHMLIFVVIGLQLGILLLCS